MKDGKKFFIYLNVLYIICILFFAIVFGSSIIINIQRENWKNVILCLITLVGIIIPVLCFLFIYYGNQVIDIQIEADNVRIITNFKEYLYNIKEINKVEKIPGKIYVYCTDKKYCFQTLYFLKEKLPDVNQWKNKLVYTIFVGFDNIK